MIESSSPSATGHPEPGRVDDSRANVVPLYAPRQRTGRGAPPDPLLRHLQGDVLRRARHQRGLTLAELARRSGISLAYLSEIERGHKEASSEILSDVCGALGLGLDDVLLACVRDLRALRMTPTGTRPTGPRPAAGPADVILLLAA